MLKRTILNTVGSTALLVCISLGSVVPAYAFEGANQIVSEVKTEQCQKSDSLVVPRYDVVLEMSTKLSINASGYASCGGTADVRNGYTCNATLALQRKSGNSWTTVEDWNSSGRTNSFSEGWYVNSGYDYRLKLSVDVYSSSGSFIESQTTCCKIRRINGI